MRNVDKEMAGRQAIWFCLVLPVLNARDDPIGSGENVDDNRDVIARLDNSLLVVTARGSHCAHLAGLQGRPWASQLMAEFLLASRASTAA